MIFPAIFSTACLPPALYFRNVARFPEILLEQYEYYKKQTIRNRYHILTANGIQTMIIPVIHTGEKQVFKNVRIAYSFPWQRLHKKTLTTAYNRSPFFEFYRDGLEFIFDTNHILLADFNNNLMVYMLECLKIKINAGFTEEYMGHVPAEKDFRNLSDLKCPSVGEITKTYPQVFSYKYGFTPGLSILDLLFNTGPVASEYLE